MAVNASWTRVTAERARHLDRRPRRQLVARSTSRVRFALARRLSGGMGNRASAPGGSRDGVPTSPSTSGRDAHVRARLADAPETYRDPSAYDILGALGVGALGSVTLSSPPRHRRGVRAQAIRKVRSRRDRSRRSRRARTRRHANATTPPTRHHTPRALPRRSLRLFPPPAPPGGSLADLLRRPRTRETPNPARLHHPPRGGRSRSRRVRGPARTSPRPPSAHRPPRRETRKSPPRPPRPRRPRRFRPRARRPRSERQVPYAPRRSRVHLPEMARGPEGPGHGWETDWWGLGVVAHELLTGEVPFRDANVHGVYAALLGCGAGVKTRSTPAFADVDPSAADFVADALRSDPRRRLGCARRGRRRDAKRHPWFRGVDFDALVEGTAPAATIRIFGGEGRTVAKISPPRREREIVPRAERRERRVEIVEVDERRAVAVVAAARYGQIATDDMATRRRGRPPPP